MLKNISSGCGLYWNFHYEIWKELKFSLAFFPKLLVPTRSLEIWKVDIFTKLKIFFQKVFSNCDILCKRKVLKCYLEFLKVRFSICYLNKYISSKWDDLYWEEFKELKFSSRFLSKDIITVHDLVKNKKSIFFCIKNILRLCLDILCEIQKENIQNFCRIF